MTKRLKTGLALIVAVLCAAVGVVGFLTPSKFLDGGVTGLSLLLTRLTAIDLAVWIILLNIPFLILGYFQIGRRFCLISFCCIVALGAAIYMLERWLPEIKIEGVDKVVVAVFGGILIGAGVGLAMRAGAVLDGTEILAVYLSRKSGISIGEIILFVNFIIFGVAAVVFDLQTAMYSTLTYFSASKTIDYILHGIEEYTGVTIISKEPHAIKVRVMEEMSRGVTVYVGKGGYTNEPREILYCVVTRLELYRLKRIVSESDADAFLFTNSLNEASGGMIKRRNLH